uniref:Iron-sulfur cluster assembly 1 homolog, mitochondrial n=1 Tax=Panagrellus redivivus TaxID=6233 RepID=A0A7E4W9F1_PANRE
MNFSRIAAATARVIKGTTRAFPADPKRRAITLTPTAVARVKELLAEQPGATALKIGVTQRGCNGYTYTLDYSSTKAKFDEEVEQDGVKVWIDMKAQLSLLGSEMDFQKTRLTEEFVFRNPNIKGTCGCGESFNI